MAKAAAKASPFAPARLPEMPPVPGVRLAACQAGIRYAGRTDLMTGRARCRHDRGRRAHPLQDLLGAGVVVPGEPEARQGACAGRQLRQRQRLHRQEGQGSDAHHGGGGRQGGGLQPERGLHRLDGRHRRAARCGQIRAPARRARQVGQGRCLASGGQRHHDHRHLPQARHAQGARSVGAPSSSTASPRAPA